MRLDVHIEEVFPHPVESVWSALTDAKALSDWLMQTSDFRPVVGTRFRLKTEGLAADGWVKAEVTELDPPRRMVWTWTLDDPDAPTTVTFELTPEAGGTRLTLTHLGEIDARAGGLIRDGWALKMHDLRRTLDRA